ncbi:MAG TPA: ABC transporter permease [Gemmatimonadales bacterium]
MKTSRMIASSFRTMARYKLRTFFMMLGTLIGVAALTVVVALGQGTRTELLHGIARMFSGSAILLSAGSGMMGDDPRAGGPTSTLTLADMDALAAAVPAIAMADPMQMGGTRTVVYQSNASDVRIIGQSENAGVVWNRGVSRGSFFTAADVQASARVALIGERVARDLFADVDPIGQQIRIGNVPFQVLGILEPFGIDPHGLDKDNEIIVPVTTVMRRLNNMDYLASAKILVEPDADLDATVFAIEDMLRERHGLAIDEQNDFHMITPVQVGHMIQATNKTFTVFLPIVAIISILVGGVVVANLMLMSVNERRHEIGLRKAIGARARDVWWQFLLEATLITTLGGVLALAVGAAALQFIARAMDTTPIFPWEVTLMGMGIAVLVGVIAGVMPARRAARMDPIASLR